ncbi:unnamed protein product [Schistosoma curassoni]|uniref:Protein kinase domain-containing protein n=1 Tax=Schistosoma curassoni TaxID=6186 RepID=A0A183KAY5_9TREM|nr:unnamed protein product [Schistosoma curassoni]
MKTSAEGKRGIQWTSKMQLDDLDFADDLALLSQTQQQMQGKTNSVAAASAALGLNIHKWKSRILRYNTECTNPITIDGEDLEDVKTFTYLNSIIDEQGGSDTDAYGIVWKAINRKTKEVVALKKNFDAFRNQTDAQRTFREIAFLQAFGNHPNIIETDLHNVIRKGNILKDIHKQYIMYQLFKATAYLHSGEVIHRDLKVPLEEPFYGMSDRKVITALVPLTALKTTAFIIN